MKSLPVQRKEKLGLKLNLMRFYKKKINKHIGLIESSCLLVRMFFLQNYSINSDKVANFHQI
jgi:hypothetical protein